MVRSQIPRSKSNESPGAIARRTKTIYSLKVFALFLSLSTLLPFITATAAATTTDNSSGDAILNATPRASTLPDHIVNGNFQYMGNTAIDKRIAGTRYLTYVDPAKKQAMEKGPEWAWATINSFNKTQFGWTSSDDSLSKYGHTNIVELQRKSTAKGGSGSKDNVWGEIVANKAGKAIYQDINTASSIPIAYTVRLKHASRNTNHNDGMQVLIGVPGKETPVTMTRTTANGLGDKKGVSSTTIRTKGTGQNDKWETYEGLYVVPQGQNTTRFTFKSIDEANKLEGNLIDDVVFEKAYPLSYDANGASGNTPAQKTKTTLANKYGLSLSTADIAAANTKATAKATSYPTELVNGTFSYPGETVLWNHKTYGRMGYVYPSAGTYDKCSKTTCVGADLKRTAVPGWDVSKFGWSTTDPTGQVELRDGPAGTTNRNPFAEITANTAGTAIHQIINTDNTVDVAYTVSLKHQPRKTNDEKMQVLIGVPGKETPVKMTRTSVNGAGDKTGVSSTTIQTKSTKFEDPKSWETYTGTVIIPAGQKLTNFTFKALQSTNSQEGNLVDDVTFEKAYKLTYDGNGGTGSTPSNSASATLSGDSTRGAAGSSISLSALKAATLPTELVNGDFEYAGTKIGLKDYIFNYVSLQKGTYYYKDNKGKNHRDSLPSGFDYSKFAWKSTQTDDNNGMLEFEKAGDVQVWNKYDGTNHYGEIAAAQKGTSIYQDINTANSSDTAYTVSLRHASLNSSHLDKMQVLVGAPGAEKPVTMTRKTTNGHGDKVGEESTTIATKVGNAKPTVGEDSDHTGQWETYVGTVVIPKGQNITRFTFKNLSSKTAYNGNILDDIVFTKAYKLDYDANGAQTGAVPTQTSTSTAVTSLAADRASTLPRELVNGDFSYKAHEAINKRGHGYALTFIDGKGQAMKTYTSWEQLPNYNASDMGWKSNDSYNGHSSIVEVQRHRADTKGTGNTWGEIAAASQSKFLYQDIDTENTVDTAYTVSLKHATRNAGDIDAMQVLIGIPGHEQAVEMTRTTANGLGDKIGEKSTTIRTNGLVEQDQWETYTGTVIIPAGQPVTRFTFKSITDSTAGGPQAEGNLIDDVVFKKSYQLKYDANGGSGSIPSSSVSGSVQTAAFHADSKKSTANNGVFYETTSTMADGSTATTRSDGSVIVRPAAEDVTAAATGYDGCQVYYPANAVITLATAARDNDCWDSSMLKKTNSAGEMQFLGWSESRHDDVRTSADAEAAGVKATTTMTTNGRTVYAVWANLPILKYDVNSPANAQQPVAPNNITGTLNQPVSDTSGWTTGDTAKIKGYKFLGWYKSAQGSELYNWSTPLTQAETTVYAHWQAIDYTIHYNGNKPATAKTEVEGSMADQKLQYDVKSNLTKNVYTLKGWKWAGWNDRADGTGTSYTDEQEIVNLVDANGGEVTLYAQWTPVPVKIIYDANGGQGSHEPTNGNAYDLLTIPTDADGKTFTRTDYRFLGWFTEPDSKTSTTGKWYYPDGSKNGDTQVQMEDHDVTLYAQWETTVPIPGDRVGLPRTGGVGLVFIIAVFALGTGVSVVKALRQIRSIREH